jgi:hypothetical protein
MKTKFISLELGMGIEPLIIGENKEIIATSSLSSSISFFLLR